VKYLIFLLALSLMGCQTMIYGSATDFNKLSVGMSKADVIKTLGDPVSTSADGDKAEEYLIYKRMKHTVSSWPRTYKVTLRDGKVVKWDEQYEEKNVNNF